jgi:hypothetical protein
MYPPAEAVSYPSNPYRKSKTLENPRSCGCHLRVGLCAGTTRHGDQ